MMRWVTGGCELILAIPILGGLIVIGTGYVALGVMLLLHIIALVLSTNQKEPGYGSIMGILTSVLAWIPFVGWFLHGLTAILLIVSAVQKTEYRER